MLELKKVKLVYNPKSGLIRSPIIIRKLIESVLVDADFEFDFAETLYHGHAGVIARNAVDEGYDAVVAVGGDGTANAIAASLLHTGVALGIIPIGSGNGLARGMKIPISVRGATKLLFNGRFRHIDAGRIQNERFFIVTGVGFDAMVGKLFNDQNIRGPLPYFTIGFREFANYRPEVFILKFDNKQIAVPALLVTIANLKGWGAGVIISPNAEPDDGLLDICILHRVKFFYALFHFPKLFTGKIDKIRKYDRYQTQKLQIIREKPGPFHVDGESHDAGLILDISVDSKALKIIVPQTDNL